MTSVVPTAPGAWTITDNAGTVLGTIVSDSKGFTAMSTAGKVVGVYQTMAAAIGALGG
jgi:hypothetical protein